MKHTTVILFALAMLIFMGCNSQEAFDCFKKSGAVVTTEISTAPFNTVIIYDDINLVLSSENTTFLRVQAGANLIHKVKFELREETLSIYNDNTCNWVRGSNPVYVYISNPDLNSINLHGYGQVSSADTIRFQSLKVVSQDSPSDIKLVLRGESLQIVSNSNSNFHLAGIVDYLDVGFYYNPGIFYGEDLQCTNVNFTHNGHNSIRVNCQYSIQGTIQNSGNVVIYGTPEIIAIDVSGTGSWTMSSD